MTSGVVSAPAGLDRRGLALLGGAHMSTDLCQAAVPWLMPLGLLLSGLGVALAGLAPSYPLTFAAITIAGLGVAAFIPRPLATPTSLRARSRRRA